MSSKKFVLKKSWWLFALLLVLVVGAATAYLSQPLLQTYWGYRYFVQNNPYSAITQWQQAQSRVSQIQQLSPFFKHDWAVWNLGLQVAILGATDVSQMATHPPQSIKEISFETLRSNSSQYSELLSQMGQELPETSLIPLFFNAQSLATSTQSLAEILTFLPSIFQDKSTWIVLLQNDNEIRATGGFMGSYALIEFDDGNLREITIEDIYDADGQFTGFIPAPPGVSEYLSSGRGLRLPDANWSIDFPTSATQIETFFNSTNAASPSGIIAITNSVMADILGVTGPIRLPDYDTQLTIDTLDTILQNRPQAFFPGSIQKKHLLNHAKNQVFFTLRHLSMQQWQAIASIVQKHMQQKNIVLFTENSDLANWLHLNRFDGAIDPPTALSGVLALIESNVGINKSNQWQNRSVQLDFTQPGLVVVQVEFTNQAPDTVRKEDSRYINYFRLVTDTNWIFRSALINGVEPEQPWVTVPATTSAGLTLLESGGLLVIPAQTSKTVEVAFEIPTDLQEVRLIKQPGLPPTAYTIIDHDGNKELRIIDSDSLLKL